MTYPLVYKDTPVIKLAICYNPFIPNDLDRHELVYDVNKTLADYMSGLPEEVAWAVAYNGEAIEQENWSEIKPAAFSHITIVRLPEGGGDTGKNILRVVALIALAFVAPWAGAALANAGMGAAAAMGASWTMGTAIALQAATTAAVMSVGGALINALLPPQGVNPDSGAGTANYSINGPKNTAREGVPAPVVYGRYRVAGNVTDLFTRNIGDDQYLLMRVLLNDGPSANVSDIQLNNQPITSYDNVAYYINYGSSNEVPASWFNTSTRMYNLNRKVRAAAWTYKTLDAVDRLRIDVNFPIGLIHVSSKGNKYDNTVKLEFKYRPIDQAGNPTGDWNFLPLEAEATLDTVSTGILRASASRSITASVIPQDNGEDQWSVTAQIRKVGDTNWSDYETRNGAYSYSSSYGLRRYAEDADDYYTRSRTSPTLSWEIKLPNAIDSYEVRFVGGTIRENTSSISYNTSTKDNVPGTVNNLTITRQTNDAFSLTYQSSTLARGRYELSIRRESEDETDLKNNPNLVFVSDIGEIDNGNVSYDGLTMLALRIKVNDQLSSQPAVSALVDGSLLKIYDEDGNVTNTAWSDNPSDIVLDILTNPLRGAPEAPNRIVFSKFAEFREFCTANNLKFNGVFDFVTSKWDAMQSVARIGHGTILPQGTKYTVAIDRASDPVMLFTGSNMYADTLQKTWVNMSDRANEIQQTYYDANDGFRQRVVRIPDSAAQARGDAVKPANPSGFGIIYDSQATAEAEYQARHNSYTTHTLSFDAPIEAIGLQLGDCALVQHDSIKYADGVGGRLEAGSTASVIKLDRPVTMTPGNSYSILINTDAIQVAAGTVTNVTGNRVAVSGLGTILPRIRRIQQAGKDRQVLKASNLGDGVWSFTLDDATGFINGQQATLWDTDVIVEKDVLLVEGESTQVTLNSALPSAPVQYSNFLFGIKTTVKKQYRLTGISTTGDMYRRTLTFTNYDARIYEPGSWGTPQITAYTVPTVGQVRNVTASWPSHPSAKASALPVTLSWQIAESTSAYAGADIYLQKADGSWASAGSVQNSTTFQMPVNRGEAVTFKVVAFDASGNRANFAIAPTVEANLTVVAVTLDSPTNFNHSVVAFSDAAKIKASWTPVADTETEGYDVSYVKCTQAEFDLFNAAANPEQYPAIITTDDAYVYTGRWTGNSADILAVAVGWYVLRIRTVKGYSTSDYTYKAMRVDYPALPLQVTNLKLANAVPTGSNTFATRDAVFTWDDVITQQAALAGVANTGLVQYLLDYKIEVLDTLNNVLRTEYTTSPRYTYSFDSNQADTKVSGKVARRNFRIRVTIRGKQGQTSSATVLEVNNPAPSIQTVTLIKNLTSTVLQFTPATDSDFGGIVVWASTTPYFTPNDSNLVFKGSGNATWPTTGGTTYYYRYAFYDTFGTDSVNVSGELSFVAGQNINAATVLYADGTSIDVLRPAEAGANVTQNNTAAGIANQGQLATQNGANWNSQVTNRPGNLAGLNGSETVDNAQMAYAAKKTFDFASGLEGISAANANIVYAGGTAVMGALSDDPVIYIPAGWQGRDVNYVRVRARPLSDNPSWEGKLYWATASYSIGEGAVKQATANPLVKNEWRVFEWNLANVTVNGVPFNDQQITTFRLDLTPGKQNWEIDWISFGAYQPDPLNLRGVRDNADQTSLNTSAGFYGQGALAVQNSLPFGSQFLTGFGSLAGLMSLGFNSSYITDRRLTYLTLANGVTQVTEPLVVTSQGTSAGFYGQGSFATRNGINLNEVGDRAAAYLGYSNGATVESLRPGEAGANVTEARTSAAFYGQGSLATRNDVNWGAHVANRPSNLSALSGSEKINNAQVGLGQNTLIDSDFLRGRAFWGNIWDNSAGAGYSVTRGLNNPGWYGQRNVLWAVLGGSAPAGNTFEVASAGASKMYWTPVKAGDRVFVSALAAYHRATQCILNVHYYDADGIYITENEVAVGGRDGGASQGNPVNFDRIGGFMTVPADGALPKPVRYVNLRLRVRTNGNPDPYGFFTEPMLCVVPENQTEWPTYSTGPSDPVADQTSTNTAAAFAGQGALATQNVLNYGSSYLSGFGSFAGRNGIALSEVGDRAAQYIGYANGYNVESLRPGEANANVTENRTSAAFYGQGALATRNDVNWASQVANRPLNIAQLSGVESIRNADRGNSDIVFPDPEFRDAAFWHLPANAALIDMDGYWAYRRGLQFYAGSFDFTSDYFPVEPGATYKIKVQISTVDFNGKFGAFIHVPNVAWYSLRHGGHRDPGVDTSDNYIKSTEWTGAMEFFFKNPTGVANNANRQWQFRFIGNLTGTAFVTFSVTRVSALGELVVRQDGQLATDAALVTSQGTAAAFYGQGSFATRNGIGLSEVSDRYAGWITYGTGATVDSLRPAEQHANITENRTAAAFQGQGALAVRNDVNWNAHVSNIPGALGTDGYGRLYAWNVSYNNGQGSVVDVNSLRPAEVGSNVTENRISSGFNGQSSWATFNGLNPSNVAGQVQRINLDGTIESGAIFKSNIGWLNQFWPQEGNANVTENRIASGFNGQNWGATASEDAASNSRVALGANLLINSDFVNGLTGWREAWNGNSSYTPIRGRNGPGPEWYGVRNVLWAAINEAPANDQVFDIYATNDGSRSTLLRYAIPVTPGERLFGSCLAAFHRAKNVTYCVVWYDANGTYLGEAGVAAGGRRDGAANGDPANFDRIGGFVTVPSGAKYVGIFFRVVCSGEGNPVAWVSEPMLCKVPANQVAWPAYNSGPVDRLADQTSSNTAAAFAGQGALATQNVLSYGSSFLQGFGSFASRSTLAFHEVTDRSATYVSYSNGWTVDSLRPAEFGSNITENRVASGFQGQGALSTQSVISYGSQFLSGFGTFAARSAINLNEAGGYVRLGGDYSAHGAVGLRIENGGFATDNLLVTAQGTAAAFAGQSPWATYSGLNPVNVAGQVRNLQTDGNIEAGAIYKSNVGWLSQTWPQEAGANVTENRTASAFYGQGAFATRNSIALHEVGDRSAAYIGYTNGWTVDSLRPGEANANITENRTSAAIAGQGWGATASEAAASNSRINLGANQCVNSGFVKGTYGFQIPANAPNGLTLYSQYNDPTWSGARNTMKFWLDTPNFTTDLCVDVIASGGFWHGGGADNAKKFSMSVIKGDRLYVRGLIARHRSRVELFLLMFDRNGNLTEAPSFWGGRDGGGQNGDPASMDVVGGFVDVNHNDSRWACIMVRMWGNNEPLPHVFLTELGMGKVASGVTVLPAYTAGPSDPVADQTSVNTAAAFAGQSPWATYNTVNPSALTATSQNLIYNGGLKLGREGFGNSHADWVKNYGSDVGHYISTNRNYAPLISDKFTVYGGNPYSIQFVAASTGTGPDLPYGYIDWHDSNGTYIGNSGANVQVPANLGYKRYTLTATAPSNAAFGVFVLQTANFNGSIWVTKIKAEMGTSATLFSDEATTGSLYKSGQLIDALKPAEANANITENRTAAAFNGQGSLATRNNVDWGAHVAGRPFNLTTLSGSESIKNADRGNTDCIYPDPLVNDPSFWNFPSNVWGINVDTYWSVRRALFFSPGSFDFSSNYFPVELGATYKIKVRIYANDANWSGRFGAYIHVPNVAWLSLKHGAGVDPGQYNSSAYIVSRTDTGDFEFIFKNPTGVANAPNNQWQFRFIGDFTGGNVVAHVTIVRVSALGDLVVRQDGQVATDSALVTSQGTAAGFQGQGAFAVRNSIALNEVNDRWAGWVTYSGGTPVNDLRPGEAGSNVTENRIASGFNGQNWGATASINAASNLYVGLGQNAVVNSDLTNGTVGFELAWEGNTGLTVQRARNWPDSSWFGSRNSFAGHIPGTPANDTVFDLYSVARSSFDLLKRYALPVTGGDRVFASCLAAFHRAKRIDVNCVWYNENGSYMGESGFGSGGRRDGGAKSDPANMDRIGGFLDVPTGAAWCALYFRVVCSGEPSPYAWVAEPFITKVAANQVAWPPYSPGPTDRMADQTSANTAAGFAGQGQLAVLNGFAFNSQYIYDRKLTYLTLANGVTEVTETLVVTAQGVAAGFQGQGSMSTQNSNNVNISGGSMNINNRFLVDGNGNVTIKSANSGARLEISNSILQVFDGNGTLRVRLGIW